MASQVQCEVRSTYLFVQITGEFSLADAQANGREFLAAGAAARRNHFLIDALQLTGHPSVADRYSYAEFMAKEIATLAAAGRLKRPRLAYMMKPPVADNLLFGLTVAVNRGMEAIVTLDQEKAVRWLAGPEGAR